MGHYACTALLSAALVLALGLAVRADPPAEKVRASRADRYGDRLPDGAQARLGTVRFRRCEDGFGLTGDGRLVLFQPGEPVRVCELPSGKVVQEIRLPEKSPARFLATSADGKLLALHIAGRVSLWRVTDGKRLWERACPAGDGLRGRVSTDGKHLVAWHPRGGVRLWETATGKVVREHRARADDPGYYVTVAVDGRILAELKDPGTLVLRDLHTGKTLHKFRPVEKDINRLLFSADGRTLVAVEGYARFGAVMHVWDVARLERKCPAVRPRHPVLADSVALSPDGKSLAACAWDGKALHVWNAVTGKRSHRVRFSGEHEADARGVRFSGDGRRLVCWQKTSLTVLDAASGRVLYKVAGPDLAPDRPPDFPADGKLLVAQDGETIRVWDAVTGDEQGPPRHTRPPVVVGFSADGLRLVTADGQVARVWDSATGRPLATFPRNGWGNGSDAAVWQVPSFGLSPDATRLASWTNDTVRVWGTPAGGALHQFPHVSPPAGGGFMGGGNFMGAGFIGQMPVVMRFTPDNRGLAVATVGETTFSVWNLAGKKSRWSVKLNGRLGALAMSPDGKSVAASTESDGDEDGDFRPGGIFLWSTSTCQPRGRALPSADEIFYSPDGRLLGSVQGKTVRVWEVATLRCACRASIPGPLVAVWFTTRGRLLALCVERKEEESTAPPWEALDLWDLDRSKRQRRFCVPGTACDLLSPTPPGAIGSVAVSPDGTLLATAMADGTVLTWDLGQTDAATPPVARLRPHELERLWADLAGEDAARAYTAVRRLSGVPSAVVPFLRGRLKPQSREDHQTLVADLGASRYAVREAATQRLLALGEHAETSLRAALAQDPPLEVARRLEGLLSRLERQPPPELLRQIRAVQVLEQIGSAASREVLAALAGGAAERRLTQEARTSLERLGRARGTRP
jgi:WD40 repeat protein